MMLPPPGAMTTAAPFAAPARGRKTVTNGASSGPSPAEPGTVPASHNGMLRYAKSSLPGVAARAGAAKHAVTEINKRGFTTRLNSNGPREGSGQGYEINNLGA